VDMVWHDAGWRILSPGKVGGGGGWARLALEMREVAAHRVGLRSRRLRGFLGCLGGFGSSRRRSMILFSYGMAVDTAVDIASSN